MGEGAESRVAATIAVELILFGEGEAALAGGLESEFGEVEVALDGAVAEVESEGERRFLEGGLELGVEAVGEDLVFGAQVYGEFT